MLLLLFLFDGGKPLEVFLGLGLALGLLPRIHFLAAHAHRVRLGVDRYGQRVGPFSWPSLQVAELAELVLGGLDSKGRVDSE